MNPCDSESPLQRASFETAYAEADPGRWAFHDSDDPLVRYLRDRRLVLAARMLETVGLRISGASALAVCGGVGGEGSFLAVRGAASVTVADYAVSALEHCRARDGRLQTVAADTQRLPFRPGSIDIVLVQDGLHHLQSPTQGLIEMLRAARSAVVVIEPHLGLVARLLGQKWEMEGDETNFVFRWRKEMIEQVANSYLRRPQQEYFVQRFWDHNVVVGNIVKRIPWQPLRLPAARLIYRSLGLLLPRAGNMLLAVIPLSPERSVGGQSL